MSARLLGRGPRAVLPGGRARRLALLLGDVATGAAAALGQAPWGLWPLTVAALALLIWHTAHAPDARTAFWRAWTVGAGHFGLALFWIINPFLVEPEIYGWMAPFALILTALGGGLFWALPVMAARRIAAGPGPVAAQRAASGPEITARAILVALALLWSDWLRGWIFTGFPWALAGHVWIDTPLAQIAAWGGALILSATTLAAAALPVVLRARPAAAIAAPVLIVALGWAAGTERLALPEPPGTGRVIRLVQPAADQTRKWDPVWAEVFWERLIDLSAGGPGDPAGPDTGPNGGTATGPDIGPDTGPGIDSSPDNSSRAGTDPHNRTRTGPVRRGGADLVVWPETSVPLLWNDAGPSLPAIAAAGGAPALIGIQRAEGERWFNSLATVTADGEAGPVYDKFHLVPFGEYMPWGDTLARVGITAFAARHGNGYTPGPGPVLMRLPGLPVVQPLICYEAIFESAIDRSAERPGWLLQVTNDAWFGTWSGPYQHLAQARLRAIETGLPLMRDANTGITAAIDARGRIGSSLPLDSAGALDAPLPGALPPTLWWRWGDAPLLTLLALATGLAVLRARDGFRRPRRTA